MKRSPVKLNGPILCPPWSSNTLEEIYERFSGLGAIGQVWETAGSAVATDADGNEREFGCLIEEWKLQAPPLVKLLSAARALSIQVHPDEDAARMLGGEKKSELWYVLEAEKDAFIYYGEKEGVTAEDICLAMEERRVAELLRKVPAKSGDVFLVPPGLIHSLGGGITVIEVQDSAGSTYRLQDISSDRETHPAESACSMRFYSDSRIRELCFGAGNGEGVLPGVMIANMREFSVSVCTGGEVSVPEGGVYMLCHEGGGRAGELSFKRGEALFYPCSCRVFLENGSRVIFAKGN